METHPSQYPALRTTLAIALFILAAVFAAVVSSILYVNFRHELESELRHRLESITTLAGLQQNGDTLVKVQKENDENFEKIRQQNLKIKRADSELRFVYTMRKDTQGIYFVVDAGFPDDPGYSPFATRYQKPGPALVENFDTMKSTVLEQGFYTDEYGTFLSGYSPIFNSAGERVGVLGVDIAATTIRARESAYLLRLILIFLSTLPFLVLVGIVSANYLARPIIGLRNMANKIMQGEYGYKISNIPRIRELAEMAADFNIMSDKLNDLINGLEQRVTERTESLIQKTSQLRTAAYIARQTAEVQDLTSLLNIVTNLITEQFGFYHTGIFLINETGDQAILRAASSDGGKRMIESGYSLPVATQNIVGYVVIQKRPRVALDIGADAVLFNNPDLAMARSEAVLPLMIRDRVLGVLDIQSDKPQAFNVDDIDVLQTLADQVAIAIDNARLLDESQAALIQLEAVTSVRTREAWSQQLEKKGRAFTFTPLGLRAEKVARKDENAVNASIVLRGQKIGNISVARKSDTQWDKMDDELLAEVAKQVGLAVENIRLLEEATKKAKQEETVGGLATRFSQSLDIDSLLQTAARALGQLPDVSEVSVFIAQQQEQTPAKRWPRR